MSHHFQEFSPTYHNKPKLINTQWKMCSSGFFARLALGDLPQNVLKFTSITIPEITEFVKTLSASCTDSSTDYVTQFIGEEPLQVVIVKHIYKIQALTFNTNLDHESIKSLLCMLRSVLHLHKSGTCIISGVDCVALQSTIVELTSHPNVPGYELTVLSTERFPENNFGQNPSICQQHIENWFNKFIRLPRNHKQLVDSAVIEEFFNRFTSVSDNMKVTCIEELLEEILETKKWDFMTRYHLFNAVAANKNSTEKELRLVLDAFDQQITNDLSVWSTWNDTMATVFLSYMERHPNQLNGAWKILRSRLFSITGSECYLDPEAASMFCF